MPRIADLLKGEDQKKRQGTIGELLASFEPMGPAPEQAGPIEPQFDRNVRETSQFFAQHPDLANPIQLPMQSLPLNLEDPAGIGGMIGGALTQSIPYVGYPAGIAGAGAGAGAMEALSNAGRMSGRGVANTLLEALGQPTNPQPTLRQALLDDPIKAAKGAALGQAIGVPAGKLAGAGIGLGRSLFGDIPPEVTAMRAAAKKLNPDLHLSAAQITQSPAAANIEGLARATPLSANVPERFYQKQGPAIASGLRDIADSVAPKMTLEDASINAEAALNAKIKAARDVYSPLYKQAEAMVKGQTFPIKNFEAAKDIVAGEASGMGKLQTSVESAVKSLLPPPKPKPPPKAPTDLSTYGVQRLSPEDVYMPPDKELTLGGALTSAVESPSLSTFVKKAGGIPYAREGFGGEQKALLESKRIPGLFNKNATHTVEEVAQQAADAGYPLDRSNLQGSFLDMLERDVRAGSDLRHQVFANPGRSLHAEEMGRLAMEEMESMDARQRLSSGLLSGQFKSVEHATDVAFETNDRALLDAIDSFGQGPGLFPAIPVAAHRKVLSELGLDGDVIDAVVGNTPIPGHASLNAMLEMKRRLSEIATKEMRGSAGDMTPKGRQAAMLAAGAAKDIAEIRGQNEPLNKTLGEAIDAYKTMYANPILNPPQIRQMRTSLDKGNYVEAANQFFGPNKEVGGLMAYQKAVGNDAYKITAASKLHAMIDAATDRQTGEFAVGRFLTDATPYLSRPRYLKQWLGPAAESFRDGVELLHKMQAGRLPSINTSGTGKVNSTLWVLSNIGIGGAAAMSGNIPGVVGAGTVMVAPPLLARLMFTPGGMDAAAKVAGMQSSVTGSELMHALAVIELAKQQTTPWEDFQAQQPMMAH